MLNSSRILPIALGALLLGGTVGALVMHRSSTSPAGVTPNSTMTDAAGTQVASNKPVDPALALKTDDTKVDVAKGAMGENERGTLVRNGHSTERVVYEPSRSRYSRRSYSQAPSRAYPARAYYDYGQPRSRSFWQKHRDKLTVAAGTGGGALLGGIIGGRKGAAIGALAGGGGSAIYTYKVRKRQRRY